MRLENYASKLRDIVLLQTEGEKLRDQSGSIFNKRMEWPIERTFETFDVLASSRELVIQLFRRIYSRDILGRTRP